MKKHLFMLLAVMVLVLGACGSDEESQQEPNEQETTEEVEGSEMAENETDSIEDIMPLDSQYDTFVASEDEYDPFVFDIKERYTSEESDSDGITEIDIMRRDQVDSDDETFDYKFSLMLAKNQEDGQDYLLFVGDVVNNTSKRVQFNHDFDIIMRDIKEEGSTYGGEGYDVELVGAYEPEFDGQGWYAFPLDTDETPEELEITFERAWDEDGAGGSGDDDEYLEIEFEME